MLTLQTEEFFPILSSDEEEEADHLESKTHNFEPFRPWLGSEKKTTITCEMEKKRCGTPLQDETTPASPPPVANLRCLLPSMPDLGEISPLPTLMTGTWDNIAAYRPVSTTAHITPVIREIAETKNPPCSTSQSEGTVNEHVNHCIPGTDLVASHVTIGYDSQGRLKSFSNIKAPPELERKPFVCNECNKRYAYLTNLYRHKRAKHGNTNYLYECPHCQFRNGRKENLRKHISTQHNGLPMPKNLRVVPFDPRAESQTPTVSRPKEVLTNKELKNSGTRSTPKKPKFVIKQTPTPTRPVPVKRKPAEYTLVVESDMKPSVIKEMIRSSRMSQESNNQSQTQAPLEQYWQRKGETSSPDPDWVNIWQEDYRFPDKREYKKRTKYVVPKPDYSALDISKIATTSTRNLSPYAYQKFIPESQNDKHEIMWSNIVPFKFSRAEKYVYHFNPNTGPIQFTPTYIRTTHSHMWPRGCTGETRQPRRTFLNRVQMLRHRETHAGHVYICACLTTA